MPSVTFWRPELKWPNMFPNGKPCCIWHKGKTSCVEHKSWRAAPRRVAGEHSTEYVWGASYECTIRRSTGNIDQQEKPYGFSSYNADAIAQMPPYVRCIDPSLTLQPNPNPFQASL
jgi:hypothetical protein